MLGWYDSIRQVFGDRCWNRPLSTKTAWKGSRCTQSTIRGCRCPWRMQRQIREKLNYWPAKKIQKTLAEDTWEHGRGPSRAHAAVPIARGACSTYLLIWGCTTAPGHTTHISPDPVEYDPAVQRLQAAELVEPAEETYGHLSSFGVVLCFFWDIVPGRREKHHN